MRQSAWLILTVLVLIFLSGSFFNPEISGEKAPDWQFALEEILVRQELDLQNYRKELQQAGEEIFATRSSELHRAQAQDLHTGFKLLQDQMNKEYELVQEQFSDKILRLQLELLLVSLNENQRIANLKQIEDLENKLQTVRIDLEADYAEKLQIMQEDHEKQSERELLSLQQDVEKILDQELASYQLHLFKELEEEISKSSFALRSVD